MKNIFLLLLYFVAPRAMAGPFDPLPSDKSIEILGMIFGSNVGTVALKGVDNPVLREMFGTLNGVVVSVGLLILGYIGVISIMNTAQEGQTLGRKWSTLWVPMRSMLGMLLLVPTPGTGYSMIQVAVMWIVVQGIGAANQVWDVVLDNLSSGISATGTVNVNTSRLESDGKEIAKQLLSSAVCMEALKKLGTGSSNAADFPTTVSPLIAQIGGSIKPWLVPGTPGGSNDNNSGSYAGSYNVGIKNDPSYGYICGKVELQANANSSEWPSGLRDSANADSKSQEIYQAKQLAIGTMFVALRQTAKQIVEDRVRPRDNSNRLAENSVPDPAGAITRAKDLYVGIMSGMIIPKESDEVQSLVSQGKINGWSVAGTYYYVLAASSSQSLFSSANIPPSLGNIPTSSNHSQVTDYMTGLEKTFFINRLKDAANYAANDRVSSSVALDLNIPSAGGSEGEKFVKMLMHPLEEMLEGIFEGFVEITTGTNDEPLVSVATFGSMLMLTTEILWLVLVGISLVISLIAICAAKSPTFSLALTVVFVVMPMIFVVCIMLWGIGATMAVYLPMIPYLMFTTAFLGWLMLVIEAIIAAPIVALGMIMPSGDELGKLQPALMILLGVFLRPMLMIFGFILAARLLRAILSYVNDTFIEAYTSIGGVQFSILLPIVLIALYAGFMIALANKTFALIYIVPDRVLRWIGGSPESTDAGAMQEAKAGFEKGKGAAQQGLKGGSEAIGGAKKRFQGAKKGAKK